MGAKWTCALCEATSAGTAVKRSKRRKAICTWCDAELMRLGFDWCPAGAHKVKIDDMTASRKICRACHVARDANRGARWARWKAAHPEYKHAYDPAARRQHHIRHRAHNLARARRYYRAHHEHMLEVFRKRREQHRERLNAADRAYRLRRKLQILRGWRRAA